MILPIVSDSHTRHSEKQKYCLNSLPFGEWSIGLTMQCFMQCCSKPDKNSGKERRKRNTMYRKLPGSKDGVERHIMEKSRREPTAGIIFLFVGSLICLCPWFLLPTSVLSILSFAVSGLPGILVGIYMIFGEKILSFDPSEKGNSSILTVYLYN